MKLKLRLLVAGIAATMFGIVAMPLAASAAPVYPACTVGPSGDYHTIQAAVNDLGCHTINVAPGVYAENVVIDHALTLNGAQAGHVVSGRTPASAAESTVSGVTDGAAVISIRAANVTVNGFSVKNPRLLSSAIGIGVKTAGDSAVITNNIIDTITTADTSSSVTAQAVYLEGGPDGVRILNNQMSNIQSRGSAKGVLVGDNGAANAPNNTTIQSNTITNVTSGAKGAYGVSVGNPAGTTEVTGLQILDNTISNLTSGTACTSTTPCGWVHAIGLEGNTPSVLVTGNSISNLVSGTPGAIAVWFESNTSFATGKVNHNDFNVPVATFGIAVHPALSGGSVDGTCNWWNSSTGPTTVSNPGGTGAQVSAEVTYNPWLVSPGGACVGGHVATNKDQCKNDGWKTLFRADGSTFKNQGQCIDYVVKHSHEIEGDVSYTAYSLKRSAEFEMNTADNKGSFEYSDANHDWYKVKVSDVKVNGNDGYFAGVVTKASNPAWVGNWLFAKVENGHPDKIWGSFTDQTTAINGVNSMSAPADGPFNVTEGNLKVN